MQDLIANLRELLEPSAVLTGEQLGGKYSVDAARRVTAEDD
jgi:hypothetical protein